MVYKPVKLQASTGPHAIRIKSLLFCIAIIACCTPIIVIWYKQGPVSINSSSVVLAIRSGTTSELIRYLNAGGDPNATTDNGYPLLFIAVVSGNIDSVKALLDNPGTDVHKKDILGASPLHYVSVGDVSHIVQYLCDAGIDVNIEDQTGKSPLFYAVLSGSTEAVSVLIRHGADIAHKDASGRAVSEYLSDVRKSSDSADFQTIYNMLHKAQ